jgi:hypothetical protein
MLTDLHKLASRKLIELRSRCAADITQLEHLIESARAIAKCAEIEIEFPEDLLRSLAKAQSDLRSSSYLSAVNIAKKLTERRATIQQCAIDQVQEVLRQRSESIASIQANIHQITREYEVQRQQATNDQQKMHNTAAEMRSGGSLSSFEKGLVPYAAVGIAIAVFGLAFLTQQFFLVWIGVVSFFVLKSKGGDIWRDLRRSKLSKKAEEIEKNADIASYDAINLAHREYEEGKATADKALSKAEAHRDKAVEAIDQLMRGKLGSAVDL